MRLEALELDRSARAASRVRWGGLAGRQHGEGSNGRPSFVLLHGLTFDRRMWDPVLEELPESHRAVAFDLPGHGGSPMLATKGLAAVVEAIHDAVNAAGLEKPIMVGHSIGGPLAAIYASQYPAAAVVSVEAPIRLEPFADMLRTIGPQLRGDGFKRVWSGLQMSWRMDLLPPARRALLRAGEEPSQEIVLGYQWDLLERPLDEVVRWRDAGLATLREAGTPYVALQANAVDPIDRAFLRERLPQAELLVWPVEHHFPHLADPVRFASLLAGLAAGLS